MNDLRRIRGLSEEVAGILERRGIATPDDLWCWLSEDFDARLALLRAYAGLSEAAMLDALAAEAVEEAERGGPPGFNRGVGAWLDRHGADVLAVAALVLLALAVAWGAGGAGPPPPAP